MQVDQTATVTQAAYAARRGVSREAVRRAVNAGRITTFGPDKRVLPDLADIEWQRNTRPRAKSAPMPQINGDQAPDVALGGYGAARARREEAEAGLAELRLRRESGSLSDREEVLSIVADAVVNFRAELESMATRLAPVLAGQPEHEVRLALDQAIEQALFTLSRNFGRLASARAPGSLVEDKEAPW